jgi:hypothetical protein
MLAAQTAVHVIAVSAAHVLLLFAFWGMHAGLQASHSLQPVMAWGHSDICTLLLHLACIWPTHHPEAEHKSAHLSSAGWMLLMLVDPWTANTWYQ